MTFPSFSYLFLPYPHRVFVPFSCNFQINCLYLHRRKLAHSWASSAIHNYEDMSTQVIQEKIANYFKTQPVVKAWLFGSYSRGEQKPWSDVDILVEMDDKQPIGLLKFAGIICDLEDLTGQKIDLVEEGTLKPFAIESVNRDKKLIYAREK